MARTLPTRRREQIEDELEEYEENNPLEARFDPRTIELLVTEGIGKHKAYSMNFDEYVENRSSVLNYDLTEKKRLCFFLPQFQSSAAVDLATAYGLGVYQFVTFMAELGLITFQFDYNDEFELVKQSRSGLLKMVTSASNKMHYMTACGLKIATGSCTNSRDGTCKKFTPAVPDWFYNAITDKAIHLGMSTTDFVYLCWCIGISKKLPVLHQNPVLFKESEIIIDDFNEKLLNYTKLIRYTQSQMIGVK